MKHLNFFRRKYKRLSPNSVLKCLSFIFSTPKANYYFLSADNLTVLLNFIGISFRWYTIDILSTAKYTKMKNKNKKTSYPAFLCDNNGILPFKRRSLQFIPLKSYTCVVNE